MCCLMLSVYLLVTAAEVPAAVVTPEVVAAVVVADGVVGELQAFEISLHVYGPQLFRLNSPHFPPHCDEHVLLAHSTWHLPLTEGQQNIPKKNLKYISKSLADGLSCIY